jgi:hypothetical protein
LYCSIDFGGYPHSEGDYSIDLSGDFAGAISQAVVTETGKPYRLAFDYGGNGFNMELNAKSKTIRLGFPEVARARVFLA